MGPDLSLHCLLRHLSLTIEGVGYTSMLFPPFSPVQMYKESYCTTPSTGGVDKMYKFYVKVFM